MNEDLTDAGWFKSSYSASKDSCVEIAFLDHDLVGVRDSKNPTGPALVFASHEWAAFTDDVRTDAFGSQH
ncbi:DUF397 domain-containing protein [Nocardia sp. NPDC051570]|uniref:DUF397 domain-containing protein n=1 Tax=Nocardia sp. NPDC051570 TaxID=3364324 RepID=UPI0037B5A2C3